MIKRQSLLIDEVTEVNARIKTKLYTEHYSKSVMYKKTGQAEPVQR